MFSTGLFVRPFLCCQSSEHDVFLKTQPILLQIGTGGLWDKDMKLSRMVSGGQRSRSQEVKGQGHRRPKVKVTGGRSLIWRPGGRTILDHLGSNRFSSFCLEFMYGSASTDRLEVHYFKLSTIGGRAFLVAASQIWKSLPDTVVSASTLQSFQHLLKTFLFQWSFIY